MSLSNVGNATSGFQHRVKSPKERTEIPRNDPEEMKIGFARAAARPSAQPTLLTRDEVATALNVQAGSEMEPAFTKLWDTLERGYRAKQHHHVDGHTMPILVNGASYIMAAEKEHIEGQPIANLTNFRLSEKSLDKLARAITPKEVKAKSVSRAVPEGYVAITELRAQPNGSAVAIKAARFEFMERLAREVGRDLRAEVAGRGEGAITVTLGRRAEEPISLRYCRIGNGRVPYRYYLYLGTTPEEKGAALGNLDKAVDRYITLDAFSSIPYAPPNFESWRRSTPQMQEERTR